MKINKLQFDVARANKCMTLQDILAVTGLSSATIAKISGGKDVSVVTAGKIANALGVDVAVLAADPEEQTQARGD